MITVISSTNRNGSECIKYARKIKSLVSERIGSDNVQLLSLEEIPGEAMHAKMFEADGQHEAVTKLQDKYLEPVKQWIFVVPEYNGSFPGVLKVFLDACSARNYQETFGGKKAALIGIASGRAGNLRGLEHLTGILNYLGVAVLPNKLPISSIESLNNDDGKVTDLETIKAIEQQIGEFLAF